MTRVRFTRDAEAQRGVNKRGFGKYFNLALENIKLTTETTEEMFLW